jgi:hypothetical protein
MIGTFPMRKQSKIFVTSISFSHLKNRSKILMNKLLKLYTPMDLEFFKKANNFLMKAHNTLKWTYCFGYYLKDQKNYKVLFQKIIRD